MESEEDIVVYMGFACRGEKINFFMFRDSEVWARKRLLVFPEPTRLTRYLPVILLAWATFGT